MAVSMFLVLSVAVAVVAAGDLKGGKDHDGKKHGGHNMMGENCQMSKEFGKAKHECYQHNETAGIFHHHGGDGPASPRHHREVDTPKGGPGKGKMMHKGHHNGTDRMNQKWEDKTPQDQEKFKCMSIKLNLISSDNKTMLTDNFKTSLRKFAKNNETGDRIDAMAANVTSSTESMATQDQFKRIHDAMQAIRQPMHKICHGKEGEGHGHQKHGPKGKMEGLKGKSE